jgi:hypothetical protein
VLGPDGAGHSWFVDPTPYRDEAFSGSTALANSAAAGREDLLTTVRREMGRIAGPRVNNGSALRSEGLPTSTRDDQALKAVFSSYGS